MENRYESKWSSAAVDGLILAAVTVICSFFVSWINKGWAGSLLWLVQLVASIWILKIVMTKYGKAHPDETTFKYGFLVCFFSSIICALWSFVLYEYIFPDTVEDMFGEVNLMLERFGQTMPDGFDEQMQVMQDNYSKMSSLSTFIKCVILGLIFSGILNGKTSLNKGVFDESESEN